MINERSWQDIWASEGVFEAEPDGREKFLITVPWPYTSGPLHVGHGRTYTIADIMARFLRMTGYNVLFPMGFHESGTPIGSISHKIASGHEPTLKLYRKYISQYESGDRVDETLRSFVHPIKVANYFSEKIINDFIALGFSIDWRRKFRSIEPNFSNMVKWQFRELGIQNRLNRGSHPVLFSIEDGNAVGEDDIEDGDTDKVSIEKFLIVLFETVGKGFYLGASSLRTETIFGITNLWYNPDIEYVLMDIENKKVVVSKLCSEKIKNQYETCKVLRTVLPEEFIHESFLIPLTQRRVNIFENSHVREGQATGFVYSVPGHSVNDLSFLSEYKIPLEPIEIITVKGELSSAKNLLKQHHNISEANLILYRNEYYDGVMVDGLEMIGGLTVRDAREKMFSVLSEKSLGFDFYECSREARTRDGKPVIVAIIHDQWFIDYLQPQWKLDTISLVNTMKFKPEFYGQNMIDVINWLEERACARQRGLGTTLPQQEGWIIESLSDSTIYPAYYTFSHLITEQNNHELKDEFFYYVLQGKVVNNYKPSPLAESCRKSFQYWYGVDRRITSAAHMSNHLVFYLFNHVALFDQKFQPRGISIAGMVISNGSKISKSKGNAVSLMDVVNTHGADIFRLYVALVAELDSTLDWNEKEVENIHGVYNSLNHLFASITDNGHNSNTSNVYVDVFLSKFAIHLRNFVNLMQGQQLRGAYVEIIYEVLKDLGDLSSLGLDQRVATDRILERWLKALSPVVPHLADHYWKERGHDNILEREILNTEDVLPSEEDQITQFEYVKGLIRDVRDIMNVTHIQPSQIDITMCGPELASEIERISRGDTDVRNKTMIGMVKKYRGKIQSGVDESVALKKFGEMIENTFTCKLHTVIMNSYSSGKIPMPGRPTIKLIGDNHE